MNTGKYFDEGVMEDFIDIAADEMDEATTLNESSKKGTKRQIHRGEKQHSSA